MYKKTVLFSASIELDIPVELYGDHDGKGDHFRRELEKLHINGVDANIFIDTDTLKIDRWW